MMDSLIRDIDRAVTVAQKCRTCRPHERAAATARRVYTQRRAAEAFAALNGWQVTKQDVYNLDLLGRSAMSNAIRMGSGDYPLLDHNIWFRQGRRYVVVVGQPYLCRRRPCQSARGVGDQNLVLYIPPDPFSSIYFPGYALFLVVTQPGVKVKWLREQEMRDWLACRGNG